MARKIDFQPVETSKSKIDFQPIDFEPEPTPIQPVMNPGRPAMLPDRPTPLIDAIGQNAQEFLGGLGESAAGAVKSIPGMIQTAGELSNPIMPLIRAAMQRSASPITEPIRNVLGPNVQELQKAGEFAGQGRGLEAAGSLAAGVVPFVGPRAKQIGEVGAESPARGAGMLTGDVALAALLNKLSSGPPRASSAAAAKIARLGEEAGPKVGREAARTAADVTISRAQNAMKSVVDNHYDNARALAASPANRLATPAGPIEGPISYAPAAAKLKPLYDELVASRLPNLDTSPAFQALKKVIETKDPVPFSSAIDDLGAINTLGDFAKIPELSKGQRTRALAIARKISAELTGSVKAEAQKLPAGGPKIVSELEAGQAAHRRMMDIFANPPEAKPTAKTAVTTGRFTTIAKDPVKLQSLMDQTRGALKPVVGRQIIDDLVSKSVDPRVGELDPVKWNNALKSYLPGGSEESLAKVFTPKQIALIKNPANLGKWSTRAMEIYSTGEKRITSFLTYRMTAGIMRKLGF